MSTITKEAIDWYPAELLRITEALQERLEGSPEIKKLVLRTVPEGPAGQAGELTELEEWIRA